MLLMIIPGIFFGNLLDIFGLTKKLSGPGKILVRIAGLPSICVAPIMMSLVSSATSNAALKTLREEEKISEQQMVYASMISSFFSSISHLPSVFIPLVALLGKIGVVFVGIRVGVSFLYAVIVAMISKRTSKSNGWNEEETAVELKSKRIPKTLIGKIERAFQRSIKTLRKILIIVIPIHFLVWYLGSIGVFSQINRFLPGFLEQTLPSDVWVVVAAHFSHLLSGASLAASLAMDGKLTGFMILYALLLGSLSATPMRTIRHSLPGYLGVFGPKQGAKILMINQLSRSTLMFLVMIVLYWIYLT